MDTIIAYRVNGGKVQVVYDEDSGDVTVFPHQDDAIAYAEANRLFQSEQADFQILVLDEL